MTLTMDHPSIRAIADKVHAGERLTFDDGVLLDEQAELHTLGRLANLVRERKNGNIAYYNTNIHLNPTNVCVYRCRFCAFRADLKDEKAYTFTDDMIRERVLEGRAAGATEIHVVGGLHHKKSFDWYLNVVRVIHETCPYQGVDACGDFLVQLYHKEASPVGARADGRSGTGKHAWRRCGDLRRRSPSADL